jgi:hypothetical protein
LLLALGPQATTIPRVFFFIAFLVTFFWFNTIAARAFVDLYDIDAPRLRRITNRVTFPGHDKSTKGQALIYAAVAYVGTILQFGLVFF